VPAVHGRQTIALDPPDELALADRLRRERSRGELLDLAAAHALGDNEQDARMRRAVWRALTKSFGHGVRIGRGALARHPETFEIGEGLIGQCALEKQRIHLANMPVDYIRVHSGLGEASPRYLITGRRAA